MTILGNGTANCELEADLRVGRVFIAQFLDMIQRAHIMYSAWHKIDWCNVKMVALAEEEDKMREGGVRAEAMEIAWKT